MLPYSDQAKYIAVIRDPKDVFVSNYHFIRDGVYGPAMPTVDTWFELFLSNDFVLGGSWAVNTAGYWAERHRPNVLIASFKEMKRDLRGTVKQVARFLNVDVDDGVVDEVCRRSTFDYMKANDRKFAMGPPKGGTTSVLSTPRRSTSAAPSADTPTSTLSTSGVPVLRDASDARPGRLRIRRGRALARRHRS